MVQPVQSCLYEIFDQNIMQFNAYSLFEIFRSNDYTVELILSILKMFKKRQNISTEIVFLNNFLSKYNRVQSIQSSKKVLERRQYVSPNIFLFKSLQQKTISFNPCSFLRNSSPKDNTAHPTLSFWKILSKRQYG